MAMGVNSVSNDIQTRRKSEAPFYVHIHRWLLSARHQKACRDHEQELLRLQEDLMSGKIDKEEMQRQVREIVNGDGEPHDEKGLENGDQAASPGYWFYSMSHDRAWEGFSGVDGCLVELLFRKTTSKRMVLTFRYLIEFEGAHSAKLFHFILLDRFAKDPHGFDNPRPILGSVELLRVSLRYAPADKSVLARWNIVHNIVSEKQMEIHEKLLSAVQKLQQLHRYGKIKDDNGEDKEDGKAKRKKKKNKKKKKKNKKTENADVEATAPKVDVQEKNDEMEDKKEDIDTRRPKAPSVDVAAEMTTTLKLDMVKRGRIYDERLTLLSSEIGELANHLETTLKLKERGKNTLIWRIQTVVQQVFPCAKTDVFGSHACGFALPSSDIDLYYIHREGYCFSSPYYQGHLGPFNAHNGCSMYQLSVVEQLDYIMNALRSEPWVRRSVVIRNAGIPILRISACLLALNGDAEETHLSTANHLCPLCTEVDLSCGTSPGHSNLISSHLLNEQAAQYPALRPLVLVLKQILVERNLSNVFAGGLSSLSLSLLVLRFLQHMRQYPNIVDFESEIAENNLVQKGPSFDVPYHVLSPSSANSRKSTPSVSPTNHGTAHEYYSRQKADWPKSENGPYYSYLPKVSYHNPGQIEGRPDGNTEQHISALERQLNGWPTNDAAHHLDWFRRMKSSASKSSDDIHKACNEKGEPPLSDQRLGWLLLGFLKFYGKHFRPKRVGITVIGDGAFYHIPHAGGGIARTPQPITIDNPCWPNLNVASSSYAISLVLRNFSEMYDELHAALVETKDVESILRIVVRAKWGSASKKILHRKLMAAKVAGEP